MSSRVPPFSFQAHFPPKPPLRMACPSDSPSGKVGWLRLSSLHCSVTLCCEFVHLPGAAVGEDPWTEQEPWADQGLLLVSHPKWESAAVNPTPPSLAFSLCPNRYLLVRVAGWRLGQPAGMQRSSGGAHTYTPPPETQQTLLQWPASYQRQQNNSALTTLVTTVVV